MQGNDKITMRPFNLRRPFYLVQLPVPQLVQQENTGNIPLGCASLRLYALHRQIPDDSVPILVSQELQSRCGDAALINHIVSLHPGTLGFTCTVWNVERVLYIAEMLRKRVPDLTVILGGPEIAQDSFFMQDPDAPFDIAIQGEGEVVIDLLLQGVPPEHIRGILTKGGKETKGSIKPSLLSSLDAIHDPFIKGVVCAENDSILLAELHRGCSYRCLFCRYHQGRPRSRPAKRSPALVKELFAWARDHAVSEIYLLDPSLEQHADFEQFLGFIASVNQPPIPLFCELRAEHITDTLAQSLSAAGVRTIETGLQTLSRNALRAMGRGFNLSRFEKGVKALQKKDIYVKTDIMIGLPKDTPEWMRKTAAYVNGLGLGQQTQLFRTQVLPGTVLRARAKQFGITHDNRPPYFVTATPAWPRDLLDTVIQTTASELDINLLPEERPLFVPFTWRNHTQGLLNENPAMVFFIGYDLEKEQGRAAAAADTFEDTANAVSICFMMQDPRCYSDLCSDTVKRFIFANPFSAVCVALAIRPHAPLDIFDRIEGILNAHILSAYSDTMFQSQSIRRPSRRLLSLLHLDTQNSLNDSWLCELQSISETIGILTCSDTDEAISLAGHIDHTMVDYIFMDFRNMIPANQWESFFKKCLQKVTVPEKILLSAPLMQWSFIQFLEKQPPSQ